MKAEFGKRDIIKLVVFPTSLNNLKTKVNNLVVGELKTLPINLKKLSNVVKNEVVKNTKFNRLNRKVNKLDKKIPYMTILIHISVYNTNKQNLEKKIEDVDTKYQMLVNWWLLLFLIQN